ncbi:MAG: septal ring lytic transglycosylase RlpA family protein [Akkermansiaceae bacterium]
MIKVLPSFAAAVLTVSCSSPEPSAKAPIPEVKKQVKKEPVERVVVRSKNKTGTPYHVKSTHHGEASWYSIKSNGGTHTASGERLREEASTAAHKTLKMGTKVRVTNLRNGKSEVVRITDRGPYIKGRIIDVTTGVAKRIGFYSRGIAPVKVEVLEKPPVEDSDS